MCVVSCARALLNVAGLAGPLVDDIAAVTVAASRAVAVGAPHTGVACPWRVMVVVVVAMVVMTSCGDDLLVVIVLGLGFGAEAHLFFSFLFSDNCSLHRTVMFVTSQ